MANAVSFLVGFAAVVIGAFLLHGAWQRAPRLGPVKPRSRVEPAQAGPVAQLAALATSHGVVGFRETIEQETRAQLVAWMAARKKAPADLPPILAAVVERSGEDAWLRDEAFGGYRGPEWLFPVWVRFTRLSESREARTIRYLDALTRALQETVKP